MRVIRYWKDHLPDALNLLSREVKDEHPRVRLEAVLSLSFISDPRSMAGAARVLDQPVDRFLDPALRLTADGLRASWLPAYESGALRFDKQEHETFVLSMAPSSASSAVAIRPLRFYSIRFESINAVSGPCFSLSSKKAHRASSTRSRNHSHPSEEEVTMRPLPSHSWMLCQLQRETDECPSNSMQPRLLNTSVNKTMMFVWPPFAWPGRSK